MNATFSKSRLPDPTKSHEASPQKREMSQHTRTDQEIQTIQAFLALLDKDIDAGTHVRPLPDDLAQAMLAFARDDACLDENFEDDVIL
uniref:hypothetical protein n=1 Tax=Castellaniella defragrans TaxID=75697 RepID=UPI00334161D5